MQHWKHEEFSYDICIPPFTKDVDDMSHEEIAMYFSWFMSVLPQRIDYLSEVCAAELSCDRSAMDLSPESLRLLWRWFLKVAKTEDAILHRRPVQRPTMQTEYILRDVGMYLGETFQRNHESLHWGYYLKPVDHYAYWPLIMGFVDRSCTPPFKMVFEPIGMAGRQAINALGAFRVEKPPIPDEDALIKLYHRWEQFCID